MNARPGRRKELIPRRYVVVGGEVPGGVGRGRSYVSAHRVMQLYGLGYRDCYLVQDADHDLRGIDLKAAIVLRPDPTGAYKLDPETGEPV